MRKFIYGLVRIFAISSLIFTSCDNFNGSNILEPICANNSESASTETSASKADRLSGKTGYVTLSGSINMGGAVPKEIAQAMQISNTENDEISSRSAFPSIPTTGITYSVTAVNTATGSTESYTGEVLTDDGNVTYRVGIPATETEKNYKVKVSVRLSGFEREYVILSGQSDEFSISSDKPVESKNITLKPESNNGSGILNLSVDVTGTEIKSAVATVNFSSNERAYIYGVLNDNQLIFKTGEHTDDELADGLSSGAWSVIFEFYKTTNRTGEKVYSFNEIVSIFENLTTDTWVQNGDEPRFVTTTDASGKKTTICRITSAMLERDKLTDIYVDSSRSTTSGAANYTTETGTFINPCTSFSKAIEKLTDATKDYTIYISGTLLGPQTIPSTVSAKTITLTGTSGNTNDILDGNQRGSALTISSSVPVIIRNLMITNGGPSVNGGGINMASGSYVELSDGVIVSGNSVTDKKGGGVYNNGGNLYLNGNAVIGKKGNEIATSSDFGNKVSGSGAGAGIYNGNNGKVLLGYKYDGSAAGKYVAATLEGGVYRNYLANTTPSSAYGGGIYNEKGTVMMSGERAYVAYNYAINGAGIALGGSASASLVMNGGVIEGNQSNSDGDGAGVYCTKGSSITMESGSVIRNNKNARNGGGVYLNYDNCSLTMNGGTIEGNEVKSEGNGGAVYMHGMSSDSKSSFKVSGDAYIPCPDGKGKNDVYILDKTSITVAGNLSRDYVASISGNSTYVIKTGYAILTNASGQSYVSSNYTKFRVISNDTKNWVVDSEGKLKSIIGNKIKPDAVGDIVFNDGSAMPYADFGALASDDKRNALKPYAIALIFYKGTGLNSDADDGTSDTTTVRTLGVGLNHYSSGQTWCLTSAKAYNNKIETILCLSTGSNGSFDFTNDKNGSDNLEQIAAFLGVSNDTGVGLNSTKSEEEAAELYPAFYFAKNYKNEKTGSESESRIPSGSEFETGWYLPSIAELFQIYAKGKGADKVFDIDAASEALGGGSFEGKIYWSSSQDNSYANYVSIFGFEQGGVSNLSKFNNNLGIRVCAIREF